MALDRQKWCAGTRSHDGTILALASIAWAPMTETVDQQAVTDLISLKLLDCCVCVAQSKPQKIAELEVTLQMIWGNLPEKNLSETLSKAFQKTGCICKSGADI